MIGYRSRIFFQFRRFALRNGDARNTFWLCNEKKKHYGGATWLKRDVTPWVREISNNQRCLVRLPTLGENNQIVYEPVRHVGAFRRDTLKIRGDRNVLTCTDDQPILTVDGFKKAGDMYVGDSFLYINLKGQLASDVICNIKIGEPNCLVYYFLTDSGNYISNKMILGGFDYL
jgi:hypothetical protein